MMSSLSGSTPAQAHRSNADANDAIHFPDVPRRADVLEPMHKNFLYFISFVLAAFRTLLPSIRLFGSPEGGQARREMIGCH